MKIILRVIKSIITLFLLVILVIVAFQKFTHNKVTIGNLYIFQIVSESMLPEYRIGDIIVVKKTKIEDLKVGDDVTYLGSAKNFDGLTITHRIIDIRVEDGKRYFTTKGMSNYIEDPEISEENIYGKVIYHTILFSFVGRLMTNIAIYYLLFITVGVSFSYEFISTFLIKKKDEDEEDDEDIDNIENISSDDLNNNNNPSEENVDNNSTLNEDSFSLNNLVANIDTQDKDISLDDDLEEIDEGGDDTEDGGKTK